MYDSFKSMYVDHQLPKRRCICANPHQHHGIYVCICVNLQRHLIISTNLLMKTTWACSPNQDTGGNHKVVAT